MSALQLDLLAPVPVRGLPEELQYRPDLISANEEAALVEHIAALPFRPFEFHGYLGNRRTVSFGFRYDFGDQAMHEAEPIPDFLRPLRDRAAEFAGLKPADLEHALVTEYAPGAGIGWHRDRPVFADVIGISLLAPCRFRLRRKQGETWQRAALDLAPRSTYLLRGPVRYEWQHSIVPMEELRYSVTFRSRA
jgi:alkylated DNA repair dioxygenase AlkB